MNRTESLHLYGTYCFTGEDRQCNFQVVINATKIYRSCFVNLPHFHYASLFSCTYFPPYSTQVLCTITFIVLPIDSTHLPSLLSSYLPGKILTWLNPNLCHLHIYSQVAEYGWRKTIILTGLTDFLATILTGSSLQLPGNHITFPNPSIPHSYQTSSHFLSPETSNSPLP